MGDQTQARALEIAERYLVKKGWKFEARDVGSLAADIILHLEARLKEGRAKIRETE